MKIGIIGAMDSEVNHLKAEISDPMPSEALGMEFVAGTLAGVDVVVVRCGVGKVNAAMCAAALIDRFGVTHVVNTGVAGALDGWLEVCDLVVSTDAVQYDLDGTPLGYAPGEVPGLPCVCFQADECLRAEASAAAVEVAGAAHVLEGRVCSGDRFVASAAEKRRITQAFGGACCEMEGAAIAQACHVAGVPFVIVRAISDKADGSGGMSYAEFEAKAADECARVVEAMLGRMPSL